MFSKRRGAPSNRRTSQDFTEAVLRLIRDRYKDFCPIWVSEKLMELHGLTVSVETLRTWMIQACLWSEESWVEYQSS